MQVYLGGAEAPTLRSRLLDSGARRLMFNYMSLRERTREPEFIDLVPEDAHVLLYSGASSANNDPDKLDAEAWWDYTQDYFATVEDNLERIDFAVEFAFLGYGLEGIHRFREEFWENLPDEKWAPVWCPDESLEDLAQRYKRVVIPADALGDEDADESLAKSMRALSHTHKVKFHVMGSTKDVWPRVAQVSSVSTSTWTSPTRFGETLLWDGHTVKRITKDDKAKGRKKHRGIIEALGCDPKLVEADDPGELSKLAVVSLLQWEERWAVTDTPKAARARTSVEQTPSTSVTPTPSVRNITPPDGREVLPIMGLTQTTDATGEHPVKMHATDSGVRVCDTCSLKAFCPKYEAGSECAYAIPVSIRDKAQLQSVMESLLEIQTQRVLFARFAEELTGGEPTKTTSVEMDRLFAMAEKMKNINDNSSFMRVTVEAQANGGMLSRLFGSDAGSAARALPSPMDPDEVIAEVLDE